MLKVKEIMTRNPVRLEADKTVREAINRMCDTKLGSLMICHGDGIVGILEEADFIRNVLAKVLNPYVTKVKDVMSIPFVIDEERTENEAGDLMNQNHVRHLAVSSNSKIVGIISIYDLIRPVYSGKSFWV